MAATDKLFNINRIRSSKNVFQICPKFKDFMLVRRDTAAALRSHPVTFNVPAVVIPDRLDRAVARYLRDMTLTSPRSFINQANALRSSLWSRLVLLEKSLAVAVRKQSTEAAYSRFGPLLPDTVQQAWDHRSHQCQDEGLEAMIMENATGILRMRKSDINRVTKMQMQELTTPIEYSKHLSDLYLVSRLASNYACCAKIFFEIKKRCPGFVPDTFFDFGSGVGSAAWAASAVWGDSLRQLTMVDASTHLLAISERLVADRGPGEEASQQNTARLRLGRHGAVSHRAYLSAGHDQADCDHLVVSAFSLLDVTGGKLQRRAVLENLWRRTGRFLVIVELGTKSGFSVVLEARDWLLSSTKEDERPAILFAPCPHSMACPKAHTSCNFKVKYEKLRLTNSSTKTVLENFSFVVLHKGPVPAAEMDAETEASVALSYPRVVTYKGGGSIQDLCMSDGAAHRFYVRPDDRTERLLLKKTAPGDFFPAVLMSPSPPEEQ